ncbi:hypothetical protein BT93_G1507 [Corymbia citriodora subsp. variegata]|nr:hypothetical protein BT93_G1507 [Corymbia citriodora subsp. variegata]
MKEQMLESYFGRGIAVDASMSIYQFFVVVGRKGTQIVEFYHLQGMFYQTIRLLEARIKPVYVFDGKPPDSKEQELAKDECLSSFSKRADASEELTVAIAVTQQHNEDCKRLLRLMGVRAVENSSTMNAPRFLRHLMDPSSRDVPVMEFEISKILEEMNLDMDQFIDLCILSGCDYCVSIRAGMEIINQQVETERSFATNRFGLAISASAMLLHVYQIPDNWPSSDAQRLLKEPIVLMEEQPEIKWTAPNEEGLISSLSDEGMASIFSDVLVSCLLEEVASFTLKERTYIILFNPAKNLFVPAKRKGSKCRLQSPNLAFKPKTFSTKVSVNSQPRFLGSFKMPTMVLGLRNFKKPLRVFCPLTWI